VYVLGVDVESGEQKPIGNRQWVAIQGLSWLPDGQGLVVVAGEQEGQSSQVWLLDYPGGDARRITNDLNTYQSVSMTADGRSLVTVQAGRYSNLWIVPVGAGPGAGRQVTSGRLEQVDQIRWGRSGKIVCRVIRDGAASLWVFDPAGGGQRIEVGSAIVTDPILTADGSQLLFTATRGDGVAHVWKIAADGGQPTQLSKGAGETLVDVDPQERWFYFRPPDGGIMRQALDPNAPATAALANPKVFGALLSRNGKQIGYPHFVTQGDRMVMQLGIAPVNDQGDIGPLTASYEPIPGVTEGRWGYNDANLVVLVTRNGVSNILDQSYSDLPPKPLTQFDTGRILSFDISPDGKQLAIGRGDVIGDAVLLADFR
jgi:dipeptidyl aminopeptidase/acylaminoacyl peptidase